MLDRDVYDHLVTTAATISDPLRASIERIGPIEFAPPTHASVAERLSVEIVNQQLSTKAALAIWKRIEAAALAQNLTANAAPSPARRARSGGAGHRVPPLSVDEETYGRTARV